MQVPPFSLQKQLSEIGQELDSAVCRVINSGHFIGGEEVKNFEASFAEACNVRYSIGCNSGTDALVLALRALDIGPGDEVITTSFSFFATAEAISNVGAKPVFVDVDPNNYLLDLKLIKQSINSSTKAILPVHLFGCPIDMTELVSLAKEKGLRIIEDCAQAAGSSWCGKSVGSMGDVGCFSFFPTKNLGAGGDGGAVTTNDPDIAKRIRELAVHGMPQRYFHTELGYNSRLDSIQAAILNVKLPLLPKWIRKRQQIAEKYHDLLDGLEGLELPFSSLESDQIHSWNQYVIRVKDDLKFDQIEEENSDLELQNPFFNLPNSKTRDLLKKKLYEKGVNTIIYYPIPIHLQPAYKELNYIPKSLPHTENLCSQVLSLPIFPELSIEEQEYVANSIKQLLER